jgi:hypothetical protein
MSSPPRRLVLALVLLACGPGKGGDTGEAGSDVSNDVESADATGAVPTSTGSTTAPTGTAAAGTDTGDTGTSTATSAGESTAGAICDQYQPDDDIGPPVTITVRHEGSAPVWVPAASCAGLVRLEILDENFQDMFSAGSNCSPTQCHEFLGSDDCTLGCDDCGVPAVVRIDPGATIAINWPGGFGAELEMTAACAPGIDCQRTCLRPTQAPAGNYGITLSGFRECTGPCECDVPAPDGWCPIWEQVETAELTLFTVSLQYPDVTAIDVVVTDP